MTFWMGRGARVSAGDAMAEDFKRSILRPYLMHMVAIRTKAF